ncbi:MAG: hypothetical protein KF751_06715 [Nitrospira sp.]|nr:hypothetical protein [Nitrospira sp.]
MRQEVSRILTGCCVLLWLTGSLSVGQGNLTAQWAAPHCPSGQAQHSQQGHNHCVWHCSGFDIQNSGGRGETSADLQVGLVWSLGTIPLRHADVDGQYPPRGPPQAVLGGV